MSQLPDADGSSELQDGPICLVIPHVAAGGVLSRNLKWAKGIEDLGQRLAVAIVRDQSSLYTHRVHPGLFTSGTAQEFPYDSLDKASTTANSLARLDFFFRSSAIIVSQFSRMHALVDRLRERGWKGAHVEVVPSEDDSVFVVNRRNLDACDIAIGVSTEITDRLRLKFPGKPIAVCPGGVEIRPLEEAARDFEINPLKICYVGRLDPISKRIFDLVEIAREARARHVACAWTLIGSGEVEQELKRRFAEAGISSVAFLGAVPHAEVRKTLCSQHVFVLPSAFEGQSNALCEAMEAGVVPLATRVSGSADAVDDGINGFLFDVGDTAGMADRIANLSRDLESWRRISRLARSKAESHLSTATSVSRLLSVIRATNVSCREASGDSLPAQHSVEWLESKWMPNAATRVVRRTWRTIKGRPADLARKP
jgi:glycosyltransferase involved in cell wall biosynthesis